MTAYRRVVVLLNGWPRAGKDTFAGYVAAAATHGSTDWRILNLSSIDVVREMLRGHGVLVDAKTPADRDLLAEVKAALEKHSLFCSRHVVKTWENLTLGLPRNVLTFIHVREKASMDAIRGLLPPTTLVISAFVDKPGTDNAGATNAADNEVDSIPYDYTVLNAGGLADLQAEAEKFVNEFIGRPAL